MTGTFAVTWHSPWRGSEGKRIPYKTIGFIVGHDSSNWIRDCTGEMVRSFEIKVRVPEYGGTVFNVDRDIVERLTKEDVLKYLL